MIIAVANEKGGSGKTTIAVNLACALANIACWLRKLERNMKKKRSVK